MLETGSLSALFVFCGVCVFDLFCFVFWNEKLCGERESHERRPQVCLRAHFFSKVECVRGLELCTCFNETCDALDACQGMIESQTSE